MQQDVSEVTSSISELTFFSKIQGIVNTTDYSLALWRLPQAQSKTLILSENITAYSLTDSFEELPAGFLFFPYDKKKQGHFMTSDFIFTLEDKKLKRPETDHETKSQDWLNEYPATSEPSTLKIPSEQPSGHAASKEQYMDLVSTCLAAIDRGEAEKIVPSRFRQVPLSEDFDAVEKFNALCAAYPNALVSLVYIHNVGCWLGASPELLVNIDETEFRTVALAGTQPFTEGMNLKSVAWTQKEIEEQALVERYIISCFKKIRLREYDEYGPKSVVAGNLLHLRSDFIVNLKETHFPQLGALMLPLLHPTSAVCGMPHENAQAFLENHEGYDRGFYAGFLGPVNIQASTSLYVNIRCMKVAYPNATLFSGAGVTSDSIPEKEWEETEMKLNTLTNILF